MTETDRWNRSCDACGKRRAPGSFRLCPQCLAERDAVREPKVITDANGCPVDWGFVTKTEARLKAVEDELAKLRERAKPVLPAAEERLALLEAALAAGKLAESPSAVGKAHTLEHGGHYFQFFDDGSIRIDTANGTLLTIGPDGFVRVVRPTNA